MSYLMVQHEVGSYEDFIEMFRSDEQRRLRSGAKGARVFRGVDDPAQAFVLVEWDDVDGARRFARSRELHEAAQWGGDRGRPCMTVVEEIGRTDGGCRDE
jgi:heme-degrading monooxygenase HmoA